MTTEMSDRQNYPLRIFEGASELQLLGFRALWVLGGFRRVVMGECPHNPITGGTHFNVLNKNSCLGP